MITLRLFWNETDASHIREEGRDCHLDWRGDLYDRRNDLRTLTMRRILEPWIPHELLTLAAEGASVLRVAAAFRRRKGIVGARARKLGCPFPTLRIVRQKSANTPYNEWRY